MKNRRKRQIFQLYYSRIKQKNIRFSKYTKADMNNLAKYEIDLLK